MSKKFYDVTSFNCDHCDEAEDFYLSKDDTFPVSNLIHGWAEVRSNEATHHLCKFCYLELLDQMKKRSIII